MKIRLLKIIFSFAVAIYMTLVVFNNLTDPNSNFRFVKAVFAMEDVFSGGTNRWRSLESPLSHVIGFSMIVGLEFVIAFFLWMGAVGMLWNYSSDTGAYLKSKMKTTVGFALGILLWFTMFITVGGEWFLMWQSEKWNAIPTAYSLTIIFLLLLIFNQQRDHDKVS